jgi:murein L,D-transpeptidase YafK
VYYITSRLARSRLPDFYGAGALPLSYPNEWDKLNGRGGSGIWLHGTPSGSFSRPPLSSDGCVVLTNQDLDRLSASVEINNTPIVISEQVEFITKAKAEAERVAANRLVDGWRRDVESMDAERLLANYSRRFRNERSEHPNAWYVQRQQAGSGGRGVALKLRDLSFFSYPGQKNLIVATFTQDASIGKSTHSIRKRQYWEREGGQWKIASETSW